MFESTDEILFTTEHLSSFRNISWPKEIKAPLHFLIPVDAYEILNDMLLHNVLIKSVIIENMVHFDLRILEPLLPQIEQVVLSGQFDMKTLPTNVTVQAIPFNTHTNVKVYNPDHRFFLHAFEYRNLRILDLEGGFSTDAFNLLVDVFHLFDNLQKLTVKTDQSLNLSHFNKRCTENILSVLIYLELIGPFSYPPKLSFVGLKRLQTLILESDIPFTALQIENLRFIGTFNLTTLQLNSKRYNVNFKKY